MLKRPPISLLLESRFLMTQELFDSFAFQLINGKEAFTDDMPSYTEMMKEESVLLNTKVTGSEVEVNLTSEFDNLDIKDNSIAYYKVSGTIIAEDYWWYFSSKRFVDQVKAAEKNPQINAHFIHVRSGGGEAWYLEKVFECIRACLKPTYVLIEQYNCSAAYYLSCGATKIVSISINDIIGSIGVMATTWNFDGYYEKEGVKRVVGYAHKSDLKNKKHTDFANGKPEQYITEELDPLQEQFETAVRSARTAIAKLPTDHPALRGETFDAQKSQEIGLIDGVVPSIEDAILECHTLGMDYKSTTTTRKNVLNYLNL